MVHIIIFFFHGKTQETFCLIIFVTSPHKKTHLFISMKCLRCRYVFVCVVITILVHLFPIDFSLVLFFLNVTFKHRL